VKTSLGIWAFGPMVTRFVPGGYKPERAGQTTVERVREAVEGLGDLIDGYEFHYPEELSADNLDEVRDALDGHDLYCIATGLHLDSRFGKGGLVSPDEAVERYGADALRLYILYMGPAEQDKEWSDAGIEGTARLVDRVWRLALEVATRVAVDAPADGELVRAAHRTIDRVSDDILRRFQFHTPIAALFELVNEIYRVKDDPSRAGEVRFASDVCTRMLPWPSSPRRRSSGYWTLRNASPETPGMP